MDGIVCLDRNGSMAGAILYTAIAYEFASITYIRALAVGSAYRNKGIGSVLLGMLAGISSKNGMNCIIGNCHRNLRPFYRRNDYRAYSPNEAMILPNDPEQIPQKPKDQYYDCWIVNPA